MNTTDLIKNLLKMNTPELKLVCREMNCKVGSKKQMIAHLVAPLLKGKYKFKMGNIPLEILRSEILEIATSNDLMKLLEFRTINRQFKNLVDDVLRSKYNKVYSKKSPDNMDIVIRRLKQALLPPFRTGKSKYHYKRFNNIGDYPIFLNYPLWADAAYTDAEKTAFKEKLKKRDDIENYSYGWPFVLEFLFVKNNREYDYLENWSLATIFNSPGFEELDNRDRWILDAIRERTNIPGNEFKSSGNTGWDDLANHINNPNSDIYKLMKKYVPKELDELRAIFEELEKNNSEFSFQRLFNLIGITKNPFLRDIGGHTFGPGSTRGNVLETTEAFMNQLFFDEHEGEEFEDAELPLKLQLRYVEHTINTLYDYKVGDYFIFYNYDYPSRQYYNISMVGYDIDTNQKVAITDGEGRPEPPIWLVNQFDRINLDFSYPEEEIMESGRY